MDNKLNKYLHEYEFPGGFGEGSFIVIAQIIVRQEVKSRPFRYIKTGQM